MKIKLIIMAGALLVTGAWAEQLPAFTTNGLPAPAAPPAQVPGLWQDSWITTNTFNATGYPFIQFGPITSSDKYMYSAGKRVGIRSEYIVKQHLKTARTNYLAWRPERAMADLLKAALLLQADINLAKPTVQVELRGCAMALEHEAERIAEGQGDPISRVDTIFHDAQKAARDFDYTAGIS